MRRLVYVTRLDDGAGTVTIYRGEIAQGKIRDYGVQPPERIEQLRNLDPVKVGQVGNRMEIFEFN